MGDDLIEAAKAAAAGTCRTLTRFIEDAVRHELGVHDHVEHSTPPALPVFSGDGVLPGVDLDSNAALLDLMTSQQ